MLIGFKLMTGIVIHQLWTKEFIRFLKFPCSRQKNQACFDGYLSVVFELSIFIHYPPMESNGICLSSCSCAEFLIQCNRAKDFQSVSFLFESIRQTNHASTDIYTLFLSCGYSSTIKCSSSLN